jgi:hypothetical protein
MRIGRNYGQMEGRKAEGKNNKWQIFLITRIKVILASRKYFLKRLITL